MEVISIDSLVPEIPCEFFNLKLTSKQTEKSNKFIGEGFEVVFRHLNSELPLETLLIDEKQFDVLKVHIEKKYIASPFPIFLSPKKLISDIIGFKVHQGVLSLGKRPDRRTMADVKYPAIALNGLVNAENVGGIVRTAQAFGVETIIVDHETCDPWIRRCVRVSMGSIFSTKVVYCENLSTFLRDALDVRPEMKILALEQDTDSISVFEKQKIANFDILILGSEKGGVSPDVQNMCRYICEIPIYKTALNSLSVNCALSAFLAVQSED